VEEYGQFSSHGHGRVLPSAGLTTFRELPSPSAQVAVRPEGPEDVVGRLHEESPV